MVSHPAVRSARLTGLRTSLPSNNRAYTNGPDSAPEPVHLGWSATPGRPVRPIVPLWCICASAYADRQFMLRLLPVRYGAATGRAGQRQRRTSSNAENARRHAPDQRRALSRPAKSAEDDNAAHQVNGNPKVGAVLGGLGVLRVESGSTWTSPDGQGRGIDSVSGRSRPRA